MEHPLAGRTAWITGAGRGIGRAIALAFARQGARVVLSARSADQVRAVAGEVASLGGWAIAVPCDVTDESSVRAAFDAAIAGCERVDVLVNNAGFVESAPIGRLDSALWDKTIAVNLTGTYYCTRAALPAMLERGAGRVVNIASVAGRVGFPYTAAYCAAKHGVLGFTRAVALEAASRGVTVQRDLPRLGGHRHDGRVDRADRRGDRPERRRGAARDRSDESAGAPHPA